MNILMTGTRLKGLRIRSLVLRNFIVSLPGRNPSVTMSASETHTAGTDRKRSKISTCFQRSERFKEGELADRKFDGGCVLFDSISLRTVLGPPDLIDCILVTSYGTDLKWFLNHFPHKTTPVTLVESSHSSLSHVYPNVQTVCPRLNSEAGRSWGIMHSKLILIKSKRNSLRICISSANLLKTDWVQMKQVFWICDITQTGSSVSDSTFGSDLHDFVRALVGENKLRTDWISIVSQFSSHISTQVPRSLHLVASILGTHSGIDLNRYGQLRIRKLLSSLENQTVFYQMSSIGKLHKPFLDSFICSVKASENNFHLLWPEYDEAMNKPGKDRVIIGQGNVKFAQKLKASNDREDSKLSKYSHWVSNPRAKSIIMRNPTGEISTNLFSPCL